MLSPPSARSLSFAVVAVWILLLRFWVVVAVVFAVVGVLGCGSTAGGGSGSERIRSGELCRTSRGDDHASDEEAAATLSCSLIQLVSWASLLALLLRLETRLSNARGEARLLAGG